MGLKSRSTHTVSAAASMPLRRYGTAGSHADMGVQVLLLETGQYVIAFEETAANYLAAAHKEREAELKAERAKARVPAGGRGAKEESDPFFDFLSALLSFPMVMLVTVEKDRREDKEMVSTFA